MAPQNAALDVADSDLAASVFSSERLLTVPELDQPGRMTYNVRQRMDGLDFLSQLEADSVPVAFFDPQYRGVLDKLSYGNEGVNRSRERTSLRQMPEDVIENFIGGIFDSLAPSGHLFLWMDKFHLCSGFSGWLSQTSFDIVDMVTWYKQRVGMGYRTRRTSEHLVVLQKPPRRAKGIWQSHDIPDVWSERVARGGSVHRKPVLLQERLISAVSNPGDVVIDPAAGSFSVLEACLRAGRNFLGCDLNG